MVSEGGHLVHFSSKIQKPKLNKPQQRRLCENASVLSGLMVYRVYAMGFQGMGPKPTKA